MALGAIVVAEDDEVKTFLFFFTRLVVDENARKKKLRGSFNNAEGVRDKPALLGPTARCCPGQALERLTPAG